MIDKPCNVISHHGTNIKGARLIMQDGFKKGTYFAFSLGDALKFGGNHVFSVAFNLPWSPDFPRDWQFIASDHISISQIVCYKVYRKPKIIYENELLRMEIYRLGMEEWEKDNNVLPEYSVLAQIDLEIEELRKKERK